MLANSMAPLTLAFAVLHAPGGGAGTLSLILAVRQISQVVVLLFSGIVADRYRRTRVMAMSDLLAAAGQVGLGLVLAAGGHHTLVIVALACLTGAAPGFFFPAAAGTVPLLVPSTHLKTANAMLRLSTNTAMIVGAGLGGPLYDLVGGPEAVILSGIPYLVSAGALFGIRLPRRSMPATTMLHQLREGWGDVRSRTWLWVLILHFGVVNAVFQASVNVLGPLVADARLGGASAWSLTIAGRAAGMVFGTLVAMRLHPQRPLRLATVATFGFVPMILALGLGSPLLVVVGCAALVGVCVDIFTVLWDTTMQQQIPEERLSRVSAYDVLGSIALSPLALGAVGPMKEALGLDHTLLTFAGILLASAVVSVSVPSVNRLRAAS